MGLKVATTDDVSGNQLQIELTVPTKRQLYSRIQLVSVCVTNLTGTGTPSMRFLDGSGTPYLASGFKMTDADFKPALLPYVTSGKGATIQIRVFSTTLTSGILTVVYDFYEG